MKSSSRRTAGVPGGVPIFQRMFTRLGCQGRPPYFVVEFHPYAGLTHTIRIRQDVVIARISDLLHDATMPVFEAVAAILLGRLYRRRVPRQFRDAYREFSYERGTRQRMLELRRDRGRRIAERPAGETHDLAPFFDRLNGEYFDGALPRPRLGWSKRAWRSMLGCFDPALDQIVLNRDLDRKHVPGYVVEYVLYHEMLHLKHPLKFARCRLESHSPTFRVEEKRYAHYEQARKFLARFS